MDLKLKKNLILSFICLLFQTLLFSNNIPLTSVKESIQKGFNDNLLEALDNFRQITKNFPNHPIGYFFEIGTIEKIQADYLNSYLESEFHELIPKGIQISKQYIKNNPDDALGYFFLSAIQAYKAIHYFRTQTKLSVFKDAVKAIHNSKKAFSIDQNLFDVYYGLGIYYYWKADLVPFMFTFSNKKLGKEEGIQMIKLASEKGIFCQAEAQGALVRILINEQKFTEALEILETNIKKYPDSAYQYSFRINIYNQLGNWNLTLKDLHTIKTLFEQKSYTGVDAWIYYHYYQGKALYKTGQKNKAISHLKKCYLLYESNKSQVNVYKKLAINSKKLCKQFKRMQKLKKT